MDFPFSRFKLPEYARHRAFSSKQSFFVVFFFVCFLIHLFASNCHITISPTPTELSSLKAIAFGAAQHKMNPGKMQEIDKMISIWFRLAWLGSAWSWICLYVVFSICFYKRCFSLLFFFSVSIYILSTFCDRIPFSFFGGKTIFIFFHPKIPYGILMNNKKHTSLWRSPHLICSWLENDSDLLNLYDFGPELVKMMSWN